MVAVELEVMAKKMDRFGWERDRGSMAHDRIISDWMDALQDYPLAEVQAACRKWVETNPRKMPNEGDIRNQIIAAREVMVERHKATLPPKPEENRERATAEQRRNILQEAGFRLKRMGGTDV